MNIEKALKRYPRISLTRTPTPLDRLDRLSEQLNLDIYLKRDDLTDLALGGDKPRKLEYELAQAVANGADTLVTCGSSQSNQARLATAAARKCGLECAVVISRDDYYAFQGNLLTVCLMAARIEVVQTDDHWDLESQALKLCRRLENEGHKPHYIPVSGSTPHSCLGYVRAGLETAAQLAARNIEIDAVYTPFGTGGIFSAMLLAFRSLGLNCPFIGVSVNRNRSRCLSNLDQWWSSLSELLLIDPGRSKGPFEITDHFIGEAYGDPTAAGLRAILLMAQNEGILLDPVYSGKMMAGFLAHHREGRWHEGQSILLVHSGGVPALFAYHKELEAHLRARGLFVPDQNDNP